MVYSISYDPRVQDEDFKQIPKHDLKQIVMTIEKKLTVDPEKYGKPLQRELKKYWKLKVGSYRVVYSIYKKTVNVLVLHIGKRKDSLVYKEATRRIFK